MHHKLTKRQVLSHKRGEAKRGKRQEVKSLQAQRAADRAARGPAPPRRKDWWIALDAGDVEALPGAEARALPRRRISADGAPPSGVVGTVIEVRSSDSLVAHDGRVVSAFLAKGARDGLPSTRSPLAVGDQVMLESAGDGHARIVTVLPRRSALSRDVYDPARRSEVFGRQVLAANIDQVVVVCSAAEPPFRPRLIDRFLVAASRDALPVVVCLNKCDLGVTASVARYAASYEALGVPVLRASALHGDGLPAVLERLEGRVSLFTGHSGVGKTSLLNAVEPGLGLRVGAVTGAAAGQGKGRHTTSSARLVPLTMAGTYVVDTPGIRALGIRGLDAPGLASHFTDIAALAPGCAYRDCLHAGEAGCAVALAARADAFLRERLESYRGLLSELG